MTLQFIRFKRLGCTAALLFDLLLFVGRRSIFLSFLCLSRVGLQEAFAFGYLLFSIFINGLCDKNKHSNFSDKLFIIIYQHMHK